MAVLDPDLPHDFWLVGVVKQGSGGQSANKVQSSEVRNPDSFDGMIVGSVSQEIKPTDCKPK